jgi:ribosomal protein S18 acetylase RimI-like enzyme
MSLEACKRFGFEPTDIKKSYSFDGNAEDLGAVSLGEEYYKPLYELVSENIPGSFNNTKEGYLSFLSDLTYKSRRGLARCKGIISDSELTSSVITSAETENAALLSAVACSSEARGMGLGKRTVLTMADELKKENKKVFVIALNSSAEGFYEKIGFSFYDYISIIR